MRRILLWNAAAIIVATVAIDIISKFLAQKIPEQGIFLISNKFIRLQLFQIENFNLCFGIKAPSAVILTTAGLIAAIALLTYFVKNNIHAPSQIFSVIVGGACANFIDRITDGAITDFISVSIFSFTWPSFNFADSAITMGLLFFVFTTLFPKKHSHPN